MPLTDVFCVCSLGSKFADEMQCHGALCTSESGVNFLGSDISPIRHSVYAFCRHMVCQHMYKALSNA